jgi:hypothetical protein
MKLIVGMLAFGFGYTLLYYGVLGYRTYDSANPQDSSNVPLSVLLGFNKKWTDIGENPGANSVYAKPPFTGWTT